PSPYTPPPSCTRYPYTTLFRSPLITGQPLDFTGFEKPFDFLVHAPHRLGLAKLVHGTGDREALLDGPATNGRDQSAELRHGGTITIHLTVGLLERQRRGNLEGRHLAKGGGQERRQDHHPLGVNGTRQGHIPLNIDNLTIPIAIGGGYPVGHPELMIPRTQHRQGVDLPDLLAPGVDQGGAVTNPLVNLIPNAAGAVFRTAQRLLHMLCPNQRGTRLLGPVVRLPQQVGDIRRVQGQLVLALRLPRPIFADAHHRLAITVTQAFILHQAGNKAGILLLAFGGARHLPFTVGHHFEQLHTLRVVLL